MTTRYPTLPCTCRSRVIRDISPKRVYVVDKESHAALPALFKQEDGLKHLRPLRKDGRDGNVRAGSRKALSSYHGMLVCRPLFATSRLMVFVVTTTAWPWRFRTPEPGSRACWSALSSCCRRNCSWPTSLQTPSVRRTLHPPALQT